MSLQHHYAPGAPLRFPQKHLGRPRTVITCQARPDSFQLYQVGIATSQQRPAGRTVLKAVCGYRPATVRLVLLPPKHQANLPVKLVQAHAGGVR